MKCADIKFVTLPLDDQSRRMYDFSSFESLPTKTDYTFVSMGSHPDVFDAYERIVLLWMELPNALIHTDTTCLGHYTKTLDKIDKIIKVFTNCPFSVEYFNRIHGFDKFEFAYHPTNLNNIPVPEEKHYDVFYSGNFPCPIDAAIPVLTKFKHCIVSHSGGTHSNIEFTDKMRLNAQSKISVVHGLLTWRDRDTKKRFPGHGAFDYVDQFPIVPQIKTRTFEAAASKSLILSLHDPWNMIESYFEPEKEFIYWYDEDDLEKKIIHILDNYGDYVPVIERAYDKLMNNFTTRHFFDTYLRNL